VLGLRICSPQLAATDKATMLWRKLKQCISSSASGGADARQSQPKTVACSVFALAFLVGQQVANRIPQTSTQPHIVGQLGEAKVREVRIHRRSNRATISMAEGAD